jgi:drug/metabolite transporter (DMT)-like permease
LTIFLYTAPFWVALLLPFFVKTERLALEQWMGMLLAFVAVAFALQDGLSPNAVDELSAKWWLGDALALAAGALWGLTTVVIRSTSLIKISPEKLLFYQVAISAVLLPIVSLHLGESWEVDWNVFTLTSIALQTVVGAFASYLVWMWLLGRYPATKLSAFVFFTPVFALLFGTWWLGEFITPGVVAALIGVAVGIVLVNRKAN